MKKENFDLKKYTGLSSQEAEARVRQEGWNELSHTKKSSLFPLLREVVSEPMFLLLVACGIVYFLLGSTGEAVMLLSFVLVIIGITLHQKQKTERTLGALREMTSPRALVFRDGKEKRIAGREVVRGDILFVKEGDRVPADAKVLESVTLFVDESFLTGESAPVRKKVWDGIKGIERPGGDDLSFVYAGTLVVQGWAVAVVYATGVHTELGKIGKALSRVEPESTPLQKEIVRIVKTLALIGLFLCIGMIVLYGLLRGSWLNGILAGITLAMAIMPEEFPVVLTIFFALGAWRISKNHVLTRRLSAIEALGSTTVLCVDKTGTLTKNRMRVAEIYTKGRFLTIEEGRKELPEYVHEIVEYSILASQKDPFDPVEAAFHQLGSSTLSHTEHLHTSWTLVREYPLSPELFALSHVWRAPDENEYIVAAKGAPEAIANLCHIPLEQWRQYEENVDAMAARGLRILGIAKAQFHKEQLPRQQHDFTFTFLGFLGLFDPVRPSAVQAVKECREAGIRVLMITGDLPATAVAVAEEIGIESCNGVITGTELALMKEDELSEKVLSVSLFARVLPEQKLQIVNALKSSGAIVAMTGDGVNDAPALKSAHIGVAMGERGTDVAREAADLVLLNDDFSSIVWAVRLGRRIFDNIKKAMGYLLAVHIPIVGMSFFPILFGWPIVLMPMHIAFLELVIDPACSIVFEEEREEPGSMKRPPRDPGEPLFGRKTIALSLFQGIVVLGAVLFLFRASAGRGLGEDETRTIAFVTLLIANLGLILTNRSWNRTIAATFKEKNQALWWVLGGSLFFLGCVLYIPFLRKLFHFSLLTPFDLILSFVAGIIGVVWFECAKIFITYRNRFALRRV